MCWYIDSVCMVKVHSKVRLLMCWFIDSVCMVKVHSKVRLLMCWYIDSVCMVKVHSKVRLLMCWFIDSVCMVEVHSKARNSAQQSNLRERKFGGPGCRPPPPPVPSPPPSTTTTTTTTPPYGSALANRCLAVHVQVASVVPSIITCMPPFLSTRPVAPLQAWKPLLCEQFSLQSGSHTSEAAPHS